MGETTTTTTINWWPGDWVGAQRQQFLDIGDGIALGTGIVTAVPVLIHRC